MEEYKYAETGVDIAKEADSVRGIIDVLASTALNRRGRAGEVMSQIGHFANFVEVGGKFLVLSTDGVGTKVLVAQEAAKYDTVGIDMVAMNANDVICVGAEPVALVDYLAVERLDADVVRDIAIGIKAGADEAGIAVIGGETASLNGVITGIEGRGFDLAGTCLGVLEKGGEILGNRIVSGDVIIGLASSGLHSNGFSLARRVILDNYGVDGVLPWGVRVSDELLAPTRLYVRPVLDVLGSFRASVHGLCHVTGGGLLNLKRLNPRVGFSVDDPLPVHDVFSEIKRLGEVDDAEMYRTFNMGMGFVIVAEPGSKELIIDVLSRHGVFARVVGRVTDKAGVVEVPSRDVVL